jgi:hypothetical protein
MPLETEKSTMTPDDLNANWPTGQDGIKFGDNHIRIVKIAVKNFYTAYGTKMQAIDKKFSDLFDGTKAKVAKLADSAEDAKKLGGTLASQFAKISGTYANLRAQATTKADVGLGSVPNYGITSSTDTNNGSLFASAAAVYAAARRGPGASTGWNTVGSYAFAKSTRYGTRANTTIAGRELRASGVNPSVGAVAQGATLSGTWRCMGNAPSRDYASLFVRIS